MRARKSATKRARKRASRLHLAARWIKRPSTKGRNEHVTSIAPLTNLTNPARVSATARRYFRKYSKDNIASRLHLAGTARMRARKSATKRARKRASRLHLAARWI